VSDSQPTTGRGGPGRAGPPTRRDLDGPAGLGATWPTKARISPITGAQSPTQGR
jgi:hypothetical protein